MLPVKTFLLGTLLLGASQMQAQKHAIIIKTGGNLIGIGRKMNQTYAGAGFSIEVNVKPRCTIVAQGGFNTRKGPYYEGSAVDARFNMTTLESEFRFYPKASLVGFYMGGSIMTHVVKSNIAGRVAPNDKHGFSGIGITTGYQFALGKKIHVQLGGGVGWMIPDNSRNTLLSYNLNAQVGYGFSFVSREK